LGAALARRDDTNDDLALMAAVARGDASARRELAMRLAPRVQRVCRALVRADVDVDDAAQGALLEILRSAASFAAVGSLERWADRIAARHAMRHAIRERRRLATLDPEVDPEDVVEPTEDAVHAEAVARRIHEYLDRIPQERRELLVLRHVLDYSTPEIAAMLEIPIGTVKERLLVARKQVRRLLLRDLAIGARAGSSA
jgi:RNA polymerase sigma-70 factor (ECF subfamily)